jgi:outer membrane protein OmpA-like peptidoglycan-associated protein
LIRSDLVLTAYHCLPGIPATLREQGSWELDRATVTFNYDRPQRGEVISVGGVLEANEQLDYAVLRLQREAPETQGVIRLLPKVPPDRTPLFMFHHPYGAPLMVLKDGTCRMTSVAAAEGRFGHQCDTRGGSSGAPVLSYDIGESEDGQPVPVAIGLHTTGLREGLNNPIDVNWATSVRAMVEASSFLASIACEADLSGIACPTLSSMAGSAASPAIVYFDWDSATLTDQARQLLDDLASKISATQVNDIVVSGHTDSVASSSYSVGLSQRMANNVREYLVSRGVPAGKIRTQSFGDSRPMVSVARGVREPNNRRVEVVACEAACP